MKINQNHILNASKQVLSSRNYPIFFIVLTFVIFSIFVVIPIILIPANSLSVQLSVFTLKDYTLLTVLSILTSSLITMQIFTYKQAKIYSSGNIATSGGSAIVAALIGTASCSACLAAIFGFLGLGTVFFLVKYQWLIVSVAIILMLISLYFTSLKLNGVCDSCKR